MRLATCALCVLPFVLASAAPAQQPGPRFAPALAGVKQIVLRETDAQPQAAVQGCGIPALSVDAALSVQLQGRSIPAVGALAAKPEPATVYLTPSIYTFDDGQTCSSWLQLRVESTEPLARPAGAPEKALRVVYWESSRMTVGPSGTVGRDVTAAFEAMAQDLVQAMPAGQDSPAPPPR